MTKSFIRNRQDGFTIVELIIVVAVIAILAAVSIVAYSGIQANARDKTVLSDVDAVASELTRYSTKNNGTYGSALVWYSGNGTNANIKFVPSGGNVIDVVTTTSDYCIRAYNTSAATYKKLSTAVTRGSTSNVCDTLPASTQAVANSPAEGAPVVPTYQDITVATKIATGDNSDLSTYTTASVSMTAGKFYLLGVNAQGTSTPVPAITMSGVTWTLLTSDTVSSGNRLSVYYASASSTVSGAITIGFTGVQTGAIWSVVELSNVNITGANGANAIAQYASNKAVDTINLTNPPTRDKNMTIGFFARQSGAAHTPAAGFTSINGAGQSTPNMAIAAIYKVNSQSVAVTVATNTVGVAIEINAAQAN